MTNPGRTLHLKLEIFEAITHMKGGKAAGPDGLPIDIYKLFKDKDLFLS